MRSRALVILFVLALTAMAVAACAAAATRPTAAAHAADPITGEWNVKFTLQGTTVPGTLKLKLDGKQVTGTAESQHTGPGTLSDGTWADNKLSFTLNFAAHESIALTGKLQDGKLSGEFRTEGMQGNWEAEKK
jgi:uncharacterized protein (DUF2147 family)